MTDDKVLRHRLAVRLCHGLIAASGLLLAFTGIGFMPLYGRFYLNALPGMAWVSDFAVQMHLHYLAAAAFSAAGAFHLVYHLRRGEFALLPRRGDLAESARTVAALLAGRQEPSHGKFLAEQRLAYLALAGTSLLLAASGLLLAFKHAGLLTLSPGAQQFTVLVHLATTFLFLALVALHLAAFVLRANRPLLPSMLTGRVTRAYAARRHPRWRP